MTTPIDMYRRALILWRAWRARKVIGPQIDALRQAIERARKAHKPRSHLLRRLRDARCAQLRMEMGMKP